MTLHGRESVLTATAAICNIKVVIDVPACFSPVRTICGGKMGTAFAFAENGLI